MENLRNQLPLQVLYAVGINSDKDASLMRALIRKFGWRPMFLDDTILEMSVAVGRIVYFRLSAMEFFTMTASSFKDEVVTVSLSPVSFLRVVKENAVLMHT